MSNAPNPNTTDHRLLHILASRDARHQHQQELLRTHPAETLLCLTVIMPGREKRNDISLTIARAALNALRHAFPDATIEERDLPTGFEAYLLTREPRLAAKRRAVAIEDTHPLGRLFDLDVLTPDATPISRQEVGEPPRRCLLCNDDARICMRLHRHSYDDLLRHIRTLVSTYTQTPPLTRAHAHI